MSHTFARFNIPRNLTSPEKSRPNGHKGAVNTGKAPRELPDSDLLSRPNGIRYCKVWQCFQQRSHHSRESIDSPLPGVLYICSLTTQTEYHVHQLNFTTEFFYYNFREKSCEFLSGDHLR